jgi:hypothetical protein
VDAPLFSPQKSREVVDASAGLWFLPPGGGWRRAGTTVMKETIHRNSHSLRFALTNLPDGITIRVEACEGREPEAIRGIQNTLSGT